MRKYILLIVLTALLIFLLLVLFIFNYKLDENSTLIDLQEFEEILSITNSDRPNMELLDMFEWEILLKAFATLLFFIYLKKLYLPFDAGFEFLITKDFEYLNYFYNWTIFF